MGKVEDGRVMIKCWSACNHESGWPSTKDQCIKSSTQGVIEFRMLGNGEVVMFDCVFGLVYREGDFNIAISQQEDVVLPQYADMVSSILERISGE